MTQDPMHSSLLTFLLALVTAALVAPGVAWAARRLGIVDRPDGQRKLHAAPVPLTGGPTILISVAMAMGICLYWYPQLLSAASNDLGFLISLGAASFLIVGLGIVDDRYSLRGRQKLFGQFLAAVVMVPSGIMIRKISLFGFPIEFGDLSAFVTVFWILGAINALNLIDGVDGLASTTGIVLSLSVAAVTWIMGGRPDGLLISLALAGALCGFLFYNFPPARMFLGDSGSMLIGLILGCVALKCSFKQYAAVALIMPTAIWAIPIFDVAMAIVRRRLTGRSIYATDRGHLHHCLVRQGHTGARLLVVVGFLCSLTGLGAIAAAAFENEMIAIVAVLTAFALLIVTRTFGHAELTLLTNRFRRFAGSLFRTSGEPRAVLHHEQVQLHGEHTWDGLWEILTDFAVSHGLDAVEMMVNLPSVGEEFHASWRTRSNVEPHHVWRSDVPLIVDGIRAGHIKLTGGADNQTFTHWLLSLGAGLQPFEDELQAVVRALKTPTTKSSGAIRLPVHARTDIQAPMGIGSI
jgi:UDP-GlcNAc:undecaprenyl-phosphate/decaprenyl-phosphate GlcNAc-1-phosphate transferase